MNKNFLIPIIAGLMMALAGLACGTTSKTTTRVDNATTAFTKSSPALNPTDTTIKPTDTLEPQIELEAGSYTSYLDSIGTLWFVGEIINKGNAPAQNVEVALSLLDDNGKVAAVGSDRFSFIQANGKFPFKIMVNKAPKEWKEVKIQIQGTPYNSKSFMPPYIDLKTDQVTGQLPDSSYGKYGLAGTVINVGQKTATLVHIVAVAYDKDGKVIDVGDTFATLTDIEPGGDSPFSLEFGTITEAPASYEVFVVSYTK